MLALLLVVWIVLIGCTDRIAESATGDNANGPAPPTELSGFGVSCRTAVSHVVSQMSLEQLAGQMIMMGIETDASGTALTTLDFESRDSLARTQPGGVVLFSGNMTGIEQLKTLVTDVTQSVDIPPFIATDYEGGMVSRLTTSGLPATRIPRAAELGRALEDSDAVDPAAWDLGVLMGEELRSLGINLNFAPVADLQSVTGDGPMDLHGRAFSADPMVVSRWVSGIVGGMQSRQVASVTKHFPGHGNAMGDSHETLPRLDRSLTELQAAEFLPFSSAFRAGGAGVMTAHIVVPEVTGPSVPASLSPRLITDILRNELEFSGLAVTDALNMRGIISDRSESLAAVSAVDAGSDMVLKPLDPLGVRDAIIQAVFSGTLTRARLEESVKRIIATKIRFQVAGPFSVTFLGDAAAILGSDEHVAMINRMTRSDRGE